MEVAMTHCGFLAWDNLGKRLYTEVNISPATISTDIR